MPKPPLTVRPKSQKTVFNTHGTAVFGTQGPEVRILSLRPVVQRVLTAAIPAGFLSEMQNGRKPGSVAAYRALAKTLAVPMEDLVGDA